jgi:hypothetical protein
MASTPTTSNSFELQGVGENLNTWGIRLNAALTAADNALDGFVTISTPGARTLSTTLYADNESRRRFLNYTNASMNGTITIPALPKWYLVRAASKDVIVTNGGSSATVRAGDIGVLITDGATVYKMPGYAEAKAYTDGALVNAMLTGVLPGQAGNAYRVLGTTGTVPAWFSLNDIPEYQADKAFLFALAVCY